MTIRGLIQQGADIDYDFILRSVVVDNNGEPIDTYNKPLFEIYLDDDGAPHIDSTYEKEDIT